MDAAFYAPLLDELRGAGPVRVAVPLTQNKGEAYHLARHVAVARGWERQLDRERNALFYEGELTAARYERWLRANAVTHVALPAGVDFDPAGTAEARVVAASPPYLRETRRAGGWRVFVVRGARGIGVASLGRESFTVRRSGTVRMRFSPYWAITRGRGCVERAPGGWTRVRVRGPAEVAPALRPRPGPRGVAAMPVTRRAEVRVVAGAAGLAAVLALAWLLFAPRTPDLAAQVFRTELFRDEGFAVFSLQWYGGHHVLGYSLLFPPLGAAVGTRVAGALAAVACAALFAAVAHRHFGDRARAGIALFAVAMTAELLVGRLTFVLGTAFALATLLAVQHERRAAAVLLAVATTAASPVAGLFLALAAVAAGAWVVAGAALGSAVVLALAFPNGGAQSWGATSFVLTLGCIALVAALLPREERVLRRGALLYAAAAVAAFAVATPMGSNATRLAALAAVPVLLASRRGALVALAVVPLLVYQWWGPVREVRKHDASADAAYYAPLLDEVRRRGAARVEVPFTRLHWESVHVATAIPLARGWEAQLDRKRNPLFYDGELTAPRYAAWLRENAVDHVALPDVALDPAGRAEGRLVRQGVPGLREVWRDEHWRVFAVLGKGPGPLPKSTPTSFGLVARRAGPVTVRMRWTRYWQVTRGRACLRRGRGGWTVVEAERPGVIEVAARLAITTGARCDAG